MQPKDLRRYIKATERTVVPATVATRVQGIGILRKLPKRLQHYIIERGSRTDPYMSFVVEPYAVFLAFEIVDMEAAERLLPPGYSLHPSAMFGDTAKRPCAILSAFTVHTNVFWGNRVEFYLIAENRETGLLSWIIEEYESNAHSYDPSRGFTLPSTSHSVVTTSYRGEVIVDVASEKSGNSLELLADLTNGVSTELDQRLWVEGNLSVDYGGELQQCTKPFSLIFDPGEMATGAQAPARRHLAVHQHVRARHARSGAVRSRGLSLRPALRHDQHPCGHVDSYGRRPRARRDRAEREPQRLSLADPNLHEDRSADPSGRSDSAWHPRRPSRSACLARPTSR